MVVVCCVENTSSHTDILPRTEKGKMAVLPALRDYMDGRTYVLELGRDIWSDIAMRELQLEALRT